MGVELTTSVRRVPGAALLSAAVIRYSARAMNPTTNIAVRAARKAGGIILRYHGRIDRLTITEKSANDFVSEVDHAAEQAIIETIRKAYPDHAILAEESGLHAGGGHRWLIDPLDGTTNFLHGFPQFSVSIALEHRGRPISAVVYDPLHEEMFVAEQGGGAYLNDHRIRVSARKGLAGALIGTGIPFRDQTHLDVYLQMMKAMIRDTAGIRRPGSAALDFAYVAAGRLDGFWELGLSPWDFAAGVLLVREAGGTVTDLNGGDRQMQTGNVIAGSIKVHAEMLHRLRPLLSDSLNA
jgi:myo-inositol-1(or 4)-monophosphatase